MKQIFLLEVEYEGVFGDDFNDVLFAGVDCENIFQEVKELLSKCLSALIGSEIIKIIEEKYNLNESTKKYLLEQFPEIEDEDCYGDSIKRIYVRSLPLELFTSLDKFDACNCIVPAAKVINEKGSSFIGYGDNILLLDDKERICGGEFLDINMDFEEETKKSISTLFVGVLDEVIEIEGEHIRGIRKL